MWQKHKEKEQLICTPDSNSIFITVASSLHFQQNHNACFNLTLSYFSASSFNQWVLSENLKCSLWVALHTAAASLRSWDVRRLNSWSWGYARRLSLGDTVFSLFAFCWESLKGLQLLKLIMQHPGGSVTTLLSLCDFYNRTVLKL